jgi:hypothetical protein
LKRSFLESVSGDYWWSWSLCVLLIITMMVM